MNRIEWNKFFTWLMAIYPQWKPDPAISAAWYNELGRVADSAETLQAAIRRINSANPSPFPPGVFQIVDAVTGDGANPLQIADAWQRARLCARGSMSMQTASQQDPALAETIRLMGGIDAIGMCDHEKLHFVERRFQELYKTAKINGVRTTRPALEKHTGFKALKDVLKDEMKEESK